MKFTTTPYEKSYAYYMSLVELYKNQYSSQFNSERAEIEKGLVQEFFDDRVKGEYERMQKFFEELLVVLSKKVKLKVFIKGYTSSRAKNNYNLALAHRRVSSLRNFLLSYKNGSFKPYLQNNQLIIEELMFGETLVPKSVADSFNDPRNSIYSVAASRERKAEISYLIRQK
ncbi:MAG: hypothetical protein MK207_08510 [Saprospiraceae bacterium]|nr:hypothetical protein [Saprospiraceae bacterium]